MTSQSRVSRQQINCWKEPQTLTPATRKSIMPLAILLIMTIGWMQTHLPWISTSPSSFPQDHHLKNVKGDVRENLLRKLPRERHLKNVKGDVRENPLRKLPWEHRLENVKGNVRENPSWMAKSMMHWSMPLSSSVSQPSCMLFQLFLGNFQSYCLTYFFNAH